MKQSIMNHIYDSFSIYLLKKAKTLYNMCLVFSKLGDITNGLDCSFDAINQLESFRNVLKTEKQFILGKLYYLQGTLHEAEQEFNLADEKYLLSREMFVKSSGINTIEYSRLLITHGQLLWQVINYRIEYFMF